MRNIWLGFVYVSFYSLIGFAIYFTESLIPLWALLLTPRTTNNKNNE